MVPGSRRIQGAIMSRIFWVVLVLAAVATLAFSPSGEPARPEPGAQAVVRAVFEGEQ